MLVLCFAIVMASTGCAGARKRTDSTIVRHIKFKGTPWNPVGDFSDHALRSQQAQQASPGMLLTWPFTYFVAPSIFRPHLLDTDLERIEVYLAHNGFFDADLTWSTRTVRKERRKRVRVVDVTGHIRMGDKTRWTRPLHLSFADDDTIEIPRSLLRAHTMLHTGRRFQLNDVYSAQASLTHLLGDYGYAAATVTPQVTVHADQQEAEVVLAIDPGPRLRIGDLRLKGSQVKREHILLDMTGLKTGEWFRSSKIEAARDTLFATGAFDQVRLTPDLAHLDGDRVPIDIEVRHALPRQLRLSATIGMDGSYLAPKGQIIWSHDNGFKKLHTFEIGLSGGLAYGFTGNQGVPLFHFWMKHHVPRLLVRRLSWELKAEVLSDIYQFSVPRTDSAVRGQFSLKPTRFLELYTSLGFGWTRLNLGDSGRGEFLAMSVLGPGFSNAYAWLDIWSGIKLDLSRKIERRIRGVTSHLQLRRVAPLNNFDNFYRIEMDVRGYVAPKRPFLGRPVQLLGRIEYREIFEGYNIPYPERLLLGGASHFRAFRQGQVGPYDCVCVPVWWADKATSEFDTRRYYLSYGFFATTMASFEAQLQRVFLPELSLAVFGEAATSGIYASDMLLPENWRVGGGVGIRYDTAIGPLRIDVSARPIYPEDDGPSFIQADDDTFGYYNCEEVGPRRRPFDILSEFGRKSDLNRSFPAINLFVTIGEAF